MTIGTLILVFNSSFRRFGFDRRNLACEAKYSTSPRSGVWVIPTHIPPFYINPTRKLEAKKSFLPQECRRKLEIYLILFVRYSPKNVRLLVWCKSAILISSRDSNLNIMFKVEAPKLADESKSPRIRILWSLEASSLKELKQRHSEVYSSGLLEFLLTREILFNHSSRYWLDPFDVCSLSSPGSRWLSVFQVDFRYHN